MLLGKYFYHSGGINSKFSFCRNGGEQHGGGLAQLTIFYAGSVNVFNDVSPEKVIISFGLYLSQPFTVYLKLSLSFIL